MRNDIVTVAKFPFSFRMCYCCNKKILLWLRLRVLLCRFACGSEESKDPGLRCGKLHALLLGCTGL